MSDMPFGWAQAEARWLEDPRSYPSICDDCEHAGSCDRDPTDCEADAAERAAEAKWEASRDAWD